MKPRKTGLGSFLLSIALALGCGDDGVDGGGGFGGVTDGGAGEAGAPVGAGGEGGEGGEPMTCGDPARDLPASDTLVWDDGVVETNLRQQNFAIEADGQEFVLNEEPVYEAVRFDLEHPATIYGFSVHWGGLAEDATPETELVAGLYADFGYNGFDFWAPEPLFVGTRCAGDIDEDGFVTYVLDEPITVEHPGLVYVAHFAEPGQPVFDFDGTTTGAGDCVAFDECHSALNLPDALHSSYYNGLSFPFQYDYLVRLHYAYDDDVQPEDTLFQPIDFPPRTRASFGDFDNDGDDDLLTEGPTLYMNDGAGVFTDVTATALAGLNIPATGGVFGDYDNDGCLDVFLYAEAYSLPDALLHNQCDGTFTDATAGSGIVDVQTYETCNDPVANTHTPTAAAAWIDIDADGLLDLYLANFICWETGTTYVNTVWHNLGDGTFEEWTGQHGFPNTKRASRGANPADMDGDGDVDLFVNAYRLQPNFFFENQGDGTVLDRALALGLAGTYTQGYYGHTIGSAWGDLNGDGRLDLVSANLAHPRFFDFSDKTEILVQGEDGTFTDLQGEWTEPRGAAGLRYQETHSVPVLADFDQDGVLDLVITAVYDGRPTDFYWGNGDGTFTLDAYHAGITTKNGWGAAASDFDLDGDLDLFATVPFENTTTDLGQWIEVRVVGNAGANRAGIGSTVRVETASATYLRVVPGGTGQGNQDSMYLHVGIGDTTEVDEIRVMFPGGEEVIYPGPFAAGERVWVYQDGSALTGLVNPT